MFQKTSTFHCLNNSGQKLTDHQHLRKVKPVWILLKQETVSGSGISWAVCKAAPRSRQITTPAPHHSQFFTGRMPLLPPNQQRQSVTVNGYGFGSLLTYLPVHSQLSEGKRLLNKAKKTSKVQQLKPELSLAGCGRPARVSRGYSTFSFVAEPRAARKTTRETGNCREREKSKNQAGGDLGRIDGMTRHVLDVITTLRRQWQCGAQHYSGGRHDTADGYSSSVTDKPVWRKAAWRGVPALFHTRLAHSRALTHTHTYCYCLSESASSVVLYCRQTILICLLLLYAVLDANKS